jgi:UDP-3-O-[3-hydroxymyristoyl] N-acetylglucosamine deacetylase/3-hydroxyacyl-[acyl-carrier-protein] dehydratase
VSQNQKTLRGPAVLSGVGLHSGQKTTLTFRPAEAGTGVAFERVDLPGRPRIPVKPESAVYDPEAGRRTILRANGAEVHTVEHVLAAVAGLGIDNVVIEIDGQEAAEPVDGSALPIAEALLAAGIVEQGAAKRFARIPETVLYHHGAIELIGIPHEGLRISFTIEYDNPTVGTQHTSFDISPETFLREIAPARTFVLHRDVEKLRDQGLIRGGSLDNAIVIGDEGVLNEKPLRFPDELVRHKVLDLLGDLFLLGRPLHGHVIARRSGHQTNVEFVKKIAEAEERSLSFTDLPPIPVEGVTPPWDINAIMTIMPHRYPLLLIDRIVHMTEDRVVGLKSVTINEPFFVGHFPGHPIMPAVLIVEAMAQCGGVLLLNKVSRPKEKLVYFMAIENAKFRRPVLPGDQLRFELTLLRFKGRICKMSGKAYVGDALAAEADLLSTLVDR